MLVVLIKERLIAVIEAFPPNRCGWHTNEMEAKLSGAVVISRLQQISIVCSAAVGRSEVVVKVLHRKPWRHAGTRGNISWGSRLRRWGCVCGYKCLRCRLGRGFIFRYPRRLWP